MAIPCEACGKPVHETVVACPHCGEHTGVQPDPIAEAEITLLPELAPPPKQIDPLPVDNDPDRRHVIDPIGRAVVGGVAKLVELVTPHRDHDDDEPVPRATARERPKK